jgi:nitroreductase
MTAPALAFPDTRPSGDAPTEVVLRAAVAYGVLAPSSHNAQPWRFLVNASELLLYADRTRALPVADPEDRELTIGCGAALFNVRTVLQHAGYGVRVRLLPDPDSPDLLARVSLVGRSTPPPGHETLVAAMRQRRTHRRPFADRPLAQAVLDELDGVAIQEGAWLYGLAADGRRAAAELVAEGDRRLFGNPGFRRELAAWTRGNGSRQLDGMPGYAFGHGALAAFVAPLVLRALDVGPSQAARDAALALDAPALVVIGTDGDTRRDWLRAGQALQHVLLAASRHGVRASFLNQPMQVAELRPRLLALTGRRGAPQMMLRLGYNSDGRATPRRALTDVLHDLP